MRLNVGPQIAYRTKQHRPLVTGSLPDFKRPDNPLGEIDLWSDRVTAVILRLHACSTMTGSGEVNKCSVLYFVLVAPLLFD